MLCGSSCSTTYNNREISFYICTSTPTSGGGSGATAAAACVILLLALILAASAATIILLYLYHQKQQQRNKWSSTAPRRRRRSIKCRFPDSVNLRDLEIVVVKTGENASSLLEQPSLSKAWMNSVSNIAQASASAANYEKTKRRRSHKCVFPEWVNLRDLEIVLVRDEEEQSEGTEQHENRQRQNINDDHEALGQNKKRIGLNKAKWRDMQEEEEVDDEQEEEEQDKTQNFLSKTIVNDKSDSEVDYDAGSPINNEDSDSDRLFSAIPLNTATLFNAEEFGKLWSPQETNKGADLKSRLSSTNPRTTPHHCCSRRGVDRILIHSVA